MLFGPLWRCSALLCAVLFQLTAACVRLPYTRKTVLRFIAAKGQPFAMQTMCFFGDRMDTRRSDPSVVEIEEGDNEDRCSRSPRHSNR